MKRFLLVTLSLGALLSSAAYASVELATAKACMACHSVDKKVIGPAFKEVAAKYAGQKDAEAKLVQKVIKGSTGVWGTMAMPPNKVTEKEAQTLVKWVLASKK